MELSPKNGWIDGQGRVYIYFTVDEVKDRLHCAVDKAVKLMRELDSEKFKRLRKWTSRVPDFGIQ